MSKDIAETSKEAQEETVNYLTDEGFANQEGRWSGAPADWFVIGGRWSGELQFKAKKEFFKKLKKEIPPKSYFGHTRTEIENNKEEVQKIWEKCGGIGENPCSRNNLNNGYDDDAMIVDEKLYKEFLKPLEKKSQSGQATSSDGFQVNFVDREYEEIKAGNFINKKWIVVVDYHN